MRRKRSTAVGMVVAVLCSILLSPPPVQAQAATPTIADTARLLGHLWADGSYDDGVWDATGPSGGSTLIENLVEQHGGSWIDRGRLTFRLPAPYDWEEWKDSLPNGDSRTRAAVRHPNFLAALLEGEGSTAGLVYDQSSCCTAGFLQGRLSDLVNLLIDRGFTSVELTQFGDSDSGEVTIGRSEFAELRASHEFICPASGGAIRVPGGEDYARYGNIRWLGPGTQYSTVVREDCPMGQPIQQVPAPTGDCVVTVDDGARLRITWSYPRGSVVIRRDGVFVDTVSALDGGYTEVRPSGSTSYQIRVNADDRRTDDACGSADSSAPVQVPPPPLARCMGLVVTHLGTGGNDLIDGTVGVDVMHGFAGNDLIRGFGQNDIICGGPGNDRIRGGFGDDRIRAGAGNDRVVSGPGADVAHGGNGDDWLEGNRGADVLDGESGDDVLRAGSGFDTLRGGRGVDVLRGGPHRDTCNGGWGLDLLAGDCEIANQ